MRNAVIVLLLLFIPVWAAPALDAPIDQVVPGKWVIPKDDASIAAGKKLFKKKCASCHGLTGQGDGPAAAALDPKPRNFTQDALKYGTDDAHLFTTVWLGAKHWKAAPKSSGMAPWKDLISPDQVLQILAYVKHEFLSKNPKFPKK